MSITTVLFDLDGTLLPMDQEVFIKDYFKRLCTKLVPHGYEPKKLVDAVWQGTVSMIKNNSDKLNEEVFWESAVSIFGDKIIKDKPIFDEFYEEEFNKVKSSCGYDKRAAETVLRLKKDGYRIVLATNPIFPSRATEWRINWAGLAPSDFELYTTYENINRSKPNPEYYLEIARRLNVMPKECIMVGNDVGDDMVARDLGMKVFLMTDCLINKDNVDISQYPNGSFDELNAYIDSLNS